MSETYTSKVFEGTPETIVTNFIGEIYGVEATIAKLIGKIIFDELGDKATPILKDAEEDAQTEADNGDERGMAELIKEQLETYFASYDYEDEGDGIHSVKYGHTWKFMTNDTIEEVAAQRSREVLDDSISSMSEADLRELLRDHWMRGRTVEEYVKDNADTDALSYDGNVWEFTDPNGVTWSYYRES